MSTDESLKKRDTPSSSEAITADAVEWGSQFVKILELEFTNAASRLSPAAKPVDFRRAMVRAVWMTLLESGAQPTQIRELFRASLLPSEETEQSAAWTSQSNSRRIELIDKMLQQSLSAEEAVEFEQLTERLRRHTDAEEFVPLEGARQLHRRLLQKESQEFP